MPNEENAERPVDQLFPQTKRRESIFQGRCIPEPLGCGKKLEKEPFLMNFKDQLSFHEYHISGFCQECQDKIFNALDHDK